MPLRLFAHPFSSYSQKVLVALYENATPFEFCLIEPGSPATAEWEALWPLKRFPVIEENGRTVIEATVAIEYLQIHHPGPVRLLPEDPDSALDVRMRDRFFDNYVMTPQGRIVFDLLRAEADRDPYGVAEARAMLDKAYAWLDREMAGREWACGDTFTLADCAAAPALFYADWSHPIDPGFANVTAYRRRLLARPSFARAVNEARRYRSYFPGGPPDRD